MVLLVHKLRRDAMEGAAMLLLKVNAKEGEDLVRSVGHCNCPCALDTTTLYGRAACSRAE